MKDKFKMYNVDQYGVRNYNSLYLLLMTVFVLYGIIAILSFPLYQLELSDPNSNIHTYKDAFWTLQMSASTIGFGDFYPVTFMGRIIVAAMFYIGVGLVGFIGAQFVNKFVSFSDTNVKNREIRKQNELIIAQNKALEEKLEALLKKSQ
ncbi:ion channel [Thalassotalea sp. PLHSN55]|uniref:ion channel n=1 Tax=Thalassotalea sp. PLHSN55 TaxID=3435888 RepID=UPI003F855CA4